MFTSGWGALVVALLVNILIPLIPWILCMRLCFWTKRNGWLLYLISRFVWVGVIAHFLFTSQLVRFSVGVGQYVLLLALLLGALGIKLFVTKKSVRTYMSSLAISGTGMQLWKSFQDLTSGYKLVTVWLLISILRFLGNAFVFTTHFPTYADDSFWNWNKPIVNILHDGGVHLFGDKEVILARGRLGYPIHIPMYKSFLSELLGGYNDIYTDLFQRLSVFFVICFLGCVTWKKTKNIFWSLLPGALIISLPLVFLHTVESYHDLPVTLYAVLTAYFFFVYIDENDFDALGLGVLLTTIMANIKIEWLLMYAAAVVCSVLVILFVQGTLYARVRELFKKSDELMRLGAYLLFFLLPFQLVRISHGLGLNPSSLETGEVLDSSVHREIFGTFKAIFLEADNYGVALLLLVVITTFFRPSLKKKEYTTLYFFLVPVMLFVFFTLVFLLTNNYQWVLNQTTVNRVYTMVFVILFAFIWLYAHDLRTTRK